MSRFYGVVQGTRGEATRCGDKTNGLSVIAASWNGAVKIELWYDNDSDKDCYRVSLVPWFGRGDSVALSEGTLNG